MKPQYGALVSIGAGALAARFANSANWLGVFLGGFIAGVSYETFSFCGQDPPAVPTLVTQDFVDLLQRLDLVAQHAAEQKLLQWVGSQIWFDICECVSGVQPTPPTPQSPPANLPTVNPPLPGYPAPTTACRTTVGPGFTQTTSNSNLQIANDIAGLDATSARITISQSVASGTGVTAHWIFEQDMIADTPVTVRVDSFNVGPTASVVKVFDIDPRANRVTLTTTFGSGTGTTLQADTLELFCGGQQPGGTVLPCCPPDPALAGQIQQILDLVTLIQRQAVPFGYVSGAVHAGLSGHGSQAISGILGVKIEVTTVPGPIGQAGLDPTELFGLGFVTFGTPDGYPSSYRLEHNPQVILPARCSAFTNIAWDLAPGTVVTITELKREP